MTKRSRFVIVPAMLVVCAVVSNAQSGPTGSEVHDRIVHGIETASTVEVKGNVHPLPRVAVDQGRLSGWFEMNRMTMFFKPTVEQESERDAVIALQQDPSSSGYHRWLTPEAFAARFGITAADMTRVKGWLQSHHFRIDEVARGRQWITFSGTTADVETAFRTEVHEFSRNGETYYANISDPSVPAALANVVLGFRSLNNFRIQPRRGSRNLAGQFTSATTGSHYLSPSDFATIYDLKTLYSTGLDGSGQAIAIMGQTDVALTDIQAFRTASGLPSRDPEVLLVPGSPDPGTSSDDLPEADLDLEWSGAVAPNAQIIYVNSGNGVFDSLEYAIDQNLAPVVSISYGACESEFSAQDFSVLEALGKQANTQGMTILTAAGDNGAADCEDPDAKVATHGLAVDVPSSLPYVTSLGGSQFSEPASSWSTTNNSNYGSVLAYLPETVWNDTAEQGTLTAGGGGKSTVYTKPSWQTGPGVPADGARDVPDISLDASNDHDGYLICSSGNCTNGFRSSSGTLFVVGGTSVSAPSFAGIMALINQRTGSPQGNVNPILYRLAVTSPAAFHDITSGNNAVPCQAGSTGCPSGGSIGYSAGFGYDQASGLGSVDVSNLIAAWTSDKTSASLPAPPTITGITPASASQGSTISVSLSGTNLSTVSSVTFGGSGIAASIEPGGTDSTLPLMLSIGADASPQSVSVTVTTAGGSITSSAIFTVVVPGVAVTAPQPISTVEQGSIQSGYVIITPDSGSTAPLPTLTYGMVNNGQVQSQASIIPETMSTSASLFVEVVPSIGRDVGIAIANPNSNANVVSLSLQDQNGLTVATTSVTLQPQQQLARFVTELFGSAIGSGIDGSLHLSSSTPFSSVGLRFDGTNFSTLPVTESTAVTGIPSRTFGSGVQANTPSAGTIGGTTAIVLPQFANGGHWASIIALMNNGTTSISGRIDILDSNGNPLPVNLNNSVQSTFRYAIPAGGVFILAPRDANGQSPM